MIIRSTIILICLVLSACATSSPEVRRQQADKLATTQHWQRLSISTQTFELAAYIPSSPSVSNTLTIYIEGDGLAWLSKYRRSPDPTPKNPLALKLALRHPVGNAAYLARPCQYMKKTQTRNCSKKYWSSHRFAPEVITASNEAITALKKRLHAKELILVGYSGGGAVAALVAARRDDVKQLITVAGNLDHREWTNFHKISPLEGSLNPADYKSKLATITQIHFVGENDQVIPPQLIHSFASKMTSPMSVKVVVVPGQTHNCCWDKIWPELIRQTNFYK